MNGSLKVVQGIVLLSFVGLMFSSCGGSQTTLSSNTTSGTTTVNPTPTSSEGESIEEEEKNATIPSGYSASNLFVTVPDSMNFLTFSSVAGSWADRCTFTSGSVVNDITCAVDVSELDLYFNGIKLQFNVPANQCKYISTEPYWYYNYEIGTGPTDVSATVTKDASGTIISSLCSVDGSGSFACGTATPPVAANDVEFDITDEFKVKCKYDTSDEYGGQNCCLGKYRLRTVTITPDSTTPTDERGKDWGGSVANCIGGHGKTDWEDVSPEGYPGPLIERVTEGLPRTKIVPVKGALESLGKRSNIPVANYFTPAKHTHTGFGTASGTTFSNAPYYVDPISDRSGSYVIPGNPYYNFDCLDEAFETNYRIRILVQDWDTVAALENYVSTGVGSADEPGTAPANCPGLSGEDCNQVKDADNFVDALSGGVYNNSSPANRANFFPKHSYK